MKILVTGGAGFIGSAVCRHLAANPQNHVVNVDKLTYAGNLASLRQIENHPNYSFVQADICDDVDDPRHFSAARRSMRSCILRPRAMSIARSTARPRFIETNIVGTFRMLNAALDLLARAAASRTKSAIQLPSHFDRRSVRRPALRQRHLHRRNALRAVLALFRFQGCFGPSGPGLA